MKKALFWMFLLLNHFAFSQKTNLKKTEQNNFKCHCSILPHRGGLSGRNSKRRIDLYNEKKASSNQTELQNQINYYPQAIDQVFTLAEDKNHDGLRIYFASYPSGTGSTQEAIDSGYSLVPPNMFGQMALIFVPTKTDPKNTESHTDDLDNCLTIKDRIMVPIDPKIASSWIIKAQNQYLEKFEADGKRVINSKYNEAHALWYKGKIFGGKLLNGLRKYLECRICSNNIDSVQIHFGAFYPKTKPSVGYQLTLLFRYHNPDKNAPFYTNDDLYEFIIKPNKKTGKLYANDSDTGKPCPPPACNTLGAMLPLQ